MGVGLGFEGLGGCAHGGLAAGVEEYILSDVVAAAEAVVELRKHRTLSSEQPGL